MIPRGRSAAACAFTSGTTSGTSASIRKAPELSTAIAPRDAATGAHCLETSSGTSNMAMSTPSKTSGVSASTSTSPPRSRSLRPADRVEAISRISPQISGRSPSSESITVPTAPVAPTTASVGRLPAAGAVIDRSPRTRLPDCQDRRVRTHCGRLGQRPAGRCRG